MSGQGINALFTQRTPPAKQVMSTWGYYNHVKHGRQLCKIIHIGENLMTVESIGNKKKVIAHSEYEPLFITPKHLYEMKYCQCQNFTLTIRGKSGVPYCNTCHSVKQDELDHDKVEWEKYSTSNKPPYGEEVLCYALRWVNPDFNPKGVRIGAITSEEGFTYAHYDTCADAYVTRLQEEDGVPDKWKPIA